MIIPAGKVIRAAKNPEEVKTRIRKLKAKIIDVNFKISRFFVLNIFDKKRKII